MESKVGKSLIGLILAGIIGLSFLSMKTQWDDAGSGGDLIPASEAKTAPNFTLADAATGQSVDLQTAAHQKPIVFSFWATWCGPCHEELPHLQKLSEKYGDRVQFYGVNGNDGAEAIQKYAAKNGLKFPMLLDNQRVASTRYSVESIPLLVIVDKAGKLRFVSNGYSPAMVEGLPQVIDSLLAEH